MLLLIPFRFEKEDETHTHSGDATANVYDHFSETQTDSQVQDCFLSYQILTDALLI